MVPAPDTPHIPRHPPHTEDTAMTHLSLTSWIPRSPDELAERLANSPVVDLATARASERLGADAPVSVTVRDERRFVVRTGLAELDGTTIEIDGDAALSEVVVRVPWNGADAGRRTLAAVTFATAAGEILAA